MQFPNLRRGINRIIVGEVMGVVSTILFGFSSFMLSLTSAALNYYNIKLIVILSSVSLVVTVTANLLNIISSIVLFTGLITARQDETKFKEAIIIIVVSLVMLVLQLFINSDIKSILVIINGLADMWVMVVVIQGFVNILDKLKDYTLAEYGIRLIKRTILLSVVTILSNITLDFFMINISFAIMGMIFTLVSAAAQIVNYIFYVGFLRKCKSLYFSKQIIYNKTI